MVAKPQKQFRFFNKQTKKNQTLLKTIFKFKLPLKGGRNSDGAVLGVERF